MLRRAFVCICALAAVMAGGVGQASAEAITYLLPAPLSLRQVDPLIRQLTLYRDLIDRKTGESQ